MTPHRTLLRAATLVLALTASATAAGAQSPRDALTVTTDWLATHLHDPGLVLLHVGDRGEYDRAHLPGARFVSMSDVSVSSHDHEKDTGLMLEMPAADDLRSRLEALGISDDSRVVVYYGSDWVSPSTRIIFTLDYAGLGNHTALLDGGMPKWKLEQHPLTAELPNATKGRLSALHVNPIVVDAAYVKSRLGSPAFHLVDGRDAVYFDGVEPSGGHKGHIPGARSIPYSAITDDKLRLRSATELAALFDRAGVGPRDTVVAYCHIGQQATAVLFAARSLGHPVLLYDGSFQDWGRRTDLPLESSGDSRSARP